jgi:hypothetical protein
MKQYDTGRHQSHQDKEASLCMLKPSYLKLFVPGPLLTLPVPPSPTRTSLKVGTFCWPAASAIFKKSKRSGEQEVTFATLSMLT